MFESAGGSETPEPVPEPDSDPAVLSSASLQARGRARTGDGPDIDRASWDGPPPWPFAIDGLVADDPPVEHVLWPDADTVPPWPGPDSGPWDLDSGPWADLDSLPWPEDAPEPASDLTPWPGGDAQLGWPIFGEVPPSPQVAALLAAVGEQNLDEFDLVEAIACWDRIAAWAAAHQVRALAELLARPIFARLSSGRDGLDPVRGTALEVSARLRVSIREAEQRIDLALALSNERRATLAALSAGRIDYWRARTLVEGLGRLDDSATAASLEQNLLEAAGHLSRAGLRAKVATAVAAAEPTAAEERHARATADRQVRCRPEADAMGSTWALMSAYDTATLDQVLDAAADGIRHAHPDDVRTHAQRRADALAHLAHTAWQTGRIGVTPASPSDRRCRCGCGGAGTIRLRPGRRPQIAVLVPFSTLIGIDEHPGELAGYGPLPASVARRSAAEGTWRRLLTDPATGQLLDYGTTRYRPPQHLVDHVVMRDQTCCGIACMRPAAACDIDHTVGYPDGPTADWNLGPPCRPHHNGKTHADWQLAQPEPGHFRWRSPTGHHYDRPPMQIGPILEPPPATTQRETKAEPPPASDPRTADTDPDPPPF